MASGKSKIRNVFLSRVNCDSTQHSFFVLFINGAQPKAGTGYKMQTVSVVFLTLHC